MSAAFAQVEREALALPAEERARLADKLWASVAEAHTGRVVMSPHLEKLLDEGMQDLDRSQTTDELRGR